tara:strand:- start:260 stop:412 length:153 start_codon:yes stop_codon:yes gene_type:complete
MSTMFGLVLGVAANADEPSTRVAAAIALRNEYGEILLIMVELFNPFGLFC